MPYGPPLPGWVVVAVVVLGALIGSAPVGLLAAWLFARFYKESRYIFF